MRSAPRAVALAVPAGAVVAVAWLRLEDPLAPLWRPVVLVALALGAASVQRRSLRAVAVLAAAVTAAWIALGVSLLPPRPLDLAAGFGLGKPFGAFAQRFDAGLVDYYGTHLPFDPGVHVEMAEIGLAAIFCFALLVALLAAARRPVAATLALVAGAGWPATLLGASGAIEVGAAMLAAGLVLLARPGSRRFALALPAAGVVVLAAAAVGSATAARQGLVRWQSWNPINAATAEVGVDFVWKSQYGGIDWPKHPAVVLRVSSTTEPHYLRAAVLDDFTGDAWTGHAPRSADSLEPEAAFQPRNQTREVVTVEGLADTRLVGGSIPIRFATDSAPIVVPWPGFAVLPDGLYRGLQYTVWSYTPQLTAADLARSPPVYPAVLLQQGMLDVGDGADLPPFGAPNRATSVAAILADHRRLDAYQPLAQLAEEVAGNAPTPYAAVARLENWFLGGSFRYSDHPHVVGPPLVGFVTTTHAGYCQFFAGAMALMLRYLGIPARVAVGFWGGTNDQGSHTWVVTNSDAHAWVEVWFSGYGWLPFDPTPPSAASTRSPIATGVGTPSAGGGEPLVLAPGHAAATGGHARPRTGPARPEAAPGSTGSHGEPVTLALLAMLALVAALGGGVVLTKEGIRIVRRLERDPRRVGAGCRRELTDFLVDQRIAARAGATVDEVGALVRREFGIDTRRFVHVATVARFGRAERAGEAALEARRELRTLLDSLRGALSRRERLAGLLSLRSLVRRARTIDGAASLGSTGS